MITPLSIYIHWPYCQAKCPYCDFNSHVAAAIDHDVWRDAYRASLAHYARELSERRSITSIFFGGGTPSLMQAQTVELIIGEIAKHWDIADDIEITLEANPGSAEAQKFADFRKAGVNRLSLGVQSFDDNALKFLGRVHDASEALRAIELARQHFPRFSFDLMYARKGQALASWNSELQQALELVGSHLSLYQLTIEPGTQFYTLNNREKLTVPDEEAAVMFETTQNILASAGLPAYEISNHARPGNESRHNLAYWYYMDYIGIGPGAHGRIRKGIAADDVFTFATEDHRAPEVWLKQVKEKGHGLRGDEPVDRSTAKREALMMGLRLTRGIDHARWQEKFDAPLAGVDAFLAPQKIQKLQNEGYLTNDAKTLKATPAGLQRLNAVLSYLLA